MSSEKREASPEASPLKGPAPKAIPEDTSDVAFEDGIPLSPMAGDQSVQFISGAPANGDAKVEIGDTGATAPSFVGLGKEELMKYANDPFWVRLRWFLFILFWVLWIAMLVGAIVIIILAPRCAEKKTPVDTFYQMKASELLKDSNIDAQTAYLEGLGVKSVVISDVLQHDSNEPEAVTDFEKFDSSINEGIFVKAIQTLREKGVKVLLQIVPNHSGTNHAWFNNDTDSDLYIRQPFDNVRKSVWVTQDKQGTSWLADPNNASLAYLQQFSGNVADLNFRNEDVKERFRSIFKTWRGKDIDGFVIAKASYLVEDLENLMNRNSTKNQPENVGVVARIVGASQGPVLVELDGASAETIQQYTDKGYIPVLTSFDSSTAEKVQQVISELFENPKVVLSLSKTSMASDKARLVNLLAGVGGSHVLVKHDENEGDAQFLKDLLKFQAENPRGKSANLKVIRSENVVAALRDDGEQHLIVANFGNNDNINLSSLNITAADNAMGDVVLATPNAGHQPGTHIHDSIDLPRLSGVVIKLATPEVE